MHIAIAVKENQKRINPEILARLQQLPLGSARPMYPTSCLACEPAYEAHHCTNGGRLSMRSNDPGGNTESGSLPLDA